MFRQIHCEILAVKKYYSKNYTQHKRLKQNIISSRECFFLSFSTLPSSSNTLTKIMTKIGREKEGIITYAWRDLTSAQLSSNVQLNFFAKPLSSVLFLGLKIQLFDLQFWRKSKMCSRDRVKCVMEKKNSIYESLVFYKFMFFG